MRVIVFFDLPSVTSAEKKSYIKFRKHLILSGFMMLQESIYCKLALNQTVADSIVSSLKRNKPSDGNVQVLIITEKQFQKIIVLVGDGENRIVNTDERLVIL